MRGSALATCLLLLAPAAASGDGRADLAELRYRFIGPLGNRVPAVTGAPGQPLVYYVGAASGGVFKSTDGGVGWEPVFDDMPAASIGAITVAPSDPNVVWVGTGETFIRSNVSIGNGVYRSTDAGQSWRHLGLDRSGRIGRVVVDPRDPDVAWVAALGHLYGPQQERGVYRTRDGGATWERVLFVDENTGAVDLALKPDNPRILYAATWQMEMSTGGRTSGGPGSGIFRSTDGGDSWERLEGHGLPAPPWGKIGLAVTAAAPERIYALIETSSNRDFAPIESFQGVLWRSDDGGRSWSMVNASNTLMQRPLYYTRAVAAPDDADEITFLAARQSLSLDGGRTFTDQSSGWDHHDMWIDPLDPARRIVGHDGGISITRDRGRSWFRPQLPTAQMYHVATDDRIPYFVYGNRQDGGSAMGPSDTLSGREIPVGAWRSVGGCEVGFTLPDPAHPGTVWSGCYDGILERFDAKSGLARDVSVWPLAIEGWPAEDLRYRIQWTAPLALSPHRPGTLYYGSQYVHRSTDGGESWDLLSPDLTSADPELMTRSGGLTLDDAGPTIAPVVFAIAESPLEPGVIWAGTNDGRVHVTRDDGATWIDVTAGLVGVPAGGTINNIEPSRHLAGRAYLTVDRHQEGDTSTYVLETSDYGSTWRTLRSDLPQGTFGYAHCVREDPVVAGLLYLGTENDLWVSFDDGASWESLRTNLPPAPVYWLTVQERFSDLVVATYGRGFWILDDLTPLRELVVARRAESYLFEPRPAYRFRSREGRWSEPASAATGRNPERGAILHYRLGAAAEGEVRLVILDSAGAPVRDLGDLPAAEGLHRVVWDLRGESSTEVELRTQPEEAFWMPLPESGTRELSDGRRWSLLEPPGSYTVELWSGEAKLASRSLEVLPDPASGGTEAGLAAQGELLRELWSLLDSSARAINRIEWLRKQLGDLREVWRARPEAGEAEGAVADLTALANDLDAALLEIEGRFFDPRLTSASQDTLRWRRLLYARLGYLARRIGQTDDPPTRQQREVFELLRRQTEEALGTLDRLLAEDVTTFNRRAGESGIGALVVIGD